MKVILKQDVKSIGKKDSLIEVSDGYAKNFLFPKGLAIEASNSNVNIMNQKKESEKSKKDKELAKAKELAEKINNSVVILKAKAGETGKLFGSITSKEISEKLKSQHNIDVDKKKMELTEAIKTLGSTVVDIRLYPGVLAKLSVKIEAEG